MSWKNIGVMLAIMFFIGCVGKALHWTYMKIEKSGYDRAIAESAEANKLFKAKLNEENQSKLEASIQIAIKKEREAIKFASEVNNAEPNITEQQIDSANFNCNTVSNDFSKLYNDAIGIPIYRSNGERTTVNGQSNQ